MLVVSSKGRGGGNGLWRTPTDQIDWSIWSRGTIPVIGLAGVRHNPNHPPLLLS